MWGVYDGGEEWHYWVRIKGLREWGYTCRCSGSLHSSVHPDDMTFGTPDPLHTCPACKLLVDKYGEREYAEVDNRE
jgi:hypothetical protein